MLRLNGKLHEFANCAGRISTSCLCTAVTSGCGMTPASSLQPLLTHAKAIAEGLAGKPGKESIEEAVQQLKSVTFAITSAGRQNQGLTPEEEVQVWSLVCLLWVWLCHTLPAELVTKDHAIAILLHPQCLCLLSVHMTHFTVCRTLV